jgi:hypothetical protein
MNNHVSSNQGNRRDGRLVAPPRRVRQALSEVMDVVSATGEREISRRMVSERASQQAFLGVSALLFAASAAVTIVWCASMSAMGEMPMTGGWTMSMACKLTPYVLSGGWANCGRTWSDSVPPSAMRDIPAYSLLWLLSSPFLTS